MVCSDAIISTCAIFVTCIYTAAIALVYIVGVLNIVRIPIYGILYLQWWSKDGTLKRTFFLRGYFGKQLLFSPDFKTFLTIDKIGTLYVLTDHS